MSDTQKISDPAFTQFEGAIRETSEALSANLRSLADAIATVEAAWTGAGAQAFRTAQTALNEDHDALRRLIDGIHDAVALTRKSSHANDADIMATFNKIDVNGSAAGGHLGSLGAGAGVSAGLESKISSY
ncbi:WXG100 family type VII secretion target [Streptomyces sp. NPDC001407]|uniref:WXG100 family type VII secretion target n=1 Tax=unclassified Streptomyces TaxID=2593676 RepID=UPI0033E53920